MENTTTPDTSSGQGQTTTTPDTSSNVSGQGGQTPSSVSGQGANQTQRESVQSQGELPPQYLQELDKRTSHFNQKITEMGQTTSQYKQQLDQLTQREKQLGETLAQYYGIAPQGQAQQVDPVNLLLENPDKFWEMAAEKTGLKSKIESIEQREQAQVIGSYLSEQQLSKQSVAEKYTFLTDDMKAQVLDIRPYMPPRVAQIEQALNDQFVSNQDKQKLTRELDHIVASSLNQLGGYEGIAERNLGKVLAQNPTQFLQQAASVYNQKQFQAQRGGQFGGNFSGGAKTSGQQSSGAVNYSSETIYK